MSTPKKATTARFWEPGPIPDFTIAEFRRRELDIGFHYVKNADGFGKDDKWKKYTGPQSPWVRVTSNGNGKSKISNQRSSDLLGNTERKGFVFLGGHGFKDAYGVNNAEGGTIMGYDVMKKPHVMNITKNSNTNHVVSRKENNIANRQANGITIGDQRQDNLEDLVPSILPCPGITGINMVINRDIIRETTIYWRCYSFAQLEYLTPFFLVPGITVLAEIGWNNVNLDSIIPIEDDLIMKDLYGNGDKIYYDYIAKNNGSYDASYGRISNFEVSNPDGQIFECKTILQSPHKGFFGIDIKNTTKVNIALKGGQRNIQSTFSEFCNLRLNSISKCLIGKGSNFFDILDQPTKLVEQPNAITGLTKDRLIFGNTTTLPESKIFSQLAPKSSPTTLPIPSTNPLLNLDIPDTKPVTKLFYGGKVENRIFTGRSSEYNIDINRGNDKSQTDWDYSNPSKFWVNMDFIVELTNAFTSVVKPGTDGDTLYTIDISDVLISAHPNMISIDGATLLIPNASAPKFNKGRDNIIDTPLYKQKCPNSIPYSSKVEVERPEDFAMYHTLRQEHFICRDDLDVIINRFLYTHGSRIPAGSAAFPIKSDVSVDGVTYEAGRYGYLKHLYVSVDKIISIIKSDTSTTSTIKTFYDKLLSDINAAAGDVWNLSIVETGKGLKIVDKRMFNPNVFGTKTNGIYQFNLATQTSIIKGFKFSTSLPTEQINQIIYGNGNNSVEESQQTSEATMMFVYGDRFNIENAGNTGNNLPKTTKTINKELKQFQEREKLAGTYQMTQMFHNVTKTPLYVIPEFREAVGSVKINNTVDDATFNIVNLAMPSKALLVSMLNDNTILNNKKNLKNTLIYSCPQSNMTLEVELLGVSGLTTFHVFSIKNLPQPYSGDNVIFQITEVSHDMKDGGWITTIKAIPRPVAGFDFHYTQL